MKARVSVHRDFKISTIDDRIYSAFLEHLGRAVYGGIYEPGHPTADADGFRGDVLDLVRDLNIPLVRYPGGNFVSNYDWMDGIGPRDKRPTRLDLAWRTTETNEIGTDEFMRWCRKANTEPMMAVNLGTKGFTEALALLEYCNHKGGSYWSDLRRKNGASHPYGVKVWCLGNEMDGPWQMNHRTAYEYGRIANEVARGMKTFDASLQLVACGSSHANMPTYPDWEREVLEECYDNVDYISLHTYWQNYESDSLNFLAKTVLLDRYIGTVSGVIDYVKAKRRSRHDVHISFDEWNVWYHSRKPDGSNDDGKDAFWRTAPPILEDVYNFEDVLLVGCALNTFIRRSDRVRVACIAQLVNVIAPIMTENGGPAWKQTTYYPYQFASLYGRGDAMNVAVDCPTYDAKVADDVPYLDVAAVRAPDARMLTLFMVNRHPTEALSIDVDLAGFDATEIAQHISIANSDLGATNTAKHQNRVVPTKGQGVGLRDGRVGGQLAGRSYHVIRIRI
ncbi:MAG TPA: alpha-N-arabinofuranosidase [Bauldia sp.]|nr:alpha-N-arabinofuranosidase [Bauldia sp.]